MSSPGNRPSNVHLFALMESLPLLTPGVGVLGEDIEGEPLLLNLLQDETAHVLVTGDHAVGKTAVLRALATSLALSSRQAELQLILIDADLAGGNSPRRTLQPVSYLPHNLTGMIVSVADALATLDFLVAEMAYRVEQTIDLPHIAVFIDHLLPLLVEGGPAVEESLQQLLNQGTEAGIHLIVATRRSDAAILAPLLAESWPVRLAGTRAGDNGHGGAGRRTDQGEFQGCMGEREVRFQAAYLEDYDLEACVESLRRDRSPALIARPLSPSRAVGAGAS